MHIITYYIRYTNVGKTIIFSYYTHQFEKKNTSYIVNYFVVKN